MVSLSSSKLSGPSRAIATAFESFIGSLLMVIFTLTVANVFSRYVLNYSFGWADELCRFMFVWIGFVGAAAVYGYGGHAALTLVVSRLRHPWNRLLREFTTLLELLIFAVFLWQGVRTVQTTVNLSPALYIPMKIVYLCVPIGALVGVVFSIEKLVALIRGRGEVA